MEPLTAVLAAAAAVGAWLICAYLAFSRTTLRTVVRLDDSGGLRHSIWTWKYPQWRGWAKTGLVVIPIALALGLLVLLTGGSDGGGGVEVEATAAADARAPSLAPTQARPATEAPSPTVSPVPTTAIPTQEAPTQTPNPTATATAQDTATLPPVPSITPTWTPSQEPAAPTTTFTPTLEPVVETPIWTPTQPPTPTQTPWPTSIPTPVRPEPLEPLLGREYKNPITFKWRGALTAGQTYQVTAYHPVSGDSLQSDLLDSPEWTADLPAQRFGEWRWQVSVVRFGVVAVTSPEWMFWFNPFPVTRFPTPTPTPTPTRTPKPPSP